MANNTGKKFGGRRKGTPNRLSKELRDALKALVDHELENLSDHLESLTPKERVEVLLKLLPFVLPKINPVAMERGEPKTYDHLTF